MAWLARCFLLVIAGSALIVASTADPRPKRLPNGVRGEVILAVTVDAHGHVEDVKILSEEPKGYNLGEAAADAMHKREFGSTKAGTYKITVNF